MLVNVGFIDLFVVRKLLFFLASCDHVISPFYYSDENVFLIGPWTVGVRIYLIVHFVANLFKTHLVHLILCDPSTDN